ncbi:MAG: ParB/RepB/Spo0J family partition protein [Ignavibacteria bacterium]|nr:ParB/RepB/Spo0J family partition protein [Ignavibacteria bacterium]
MKASKTVLGKGLGALIRESTSQEEVKKIPDTKVESLEVISKIPVERIEPNPYQPRIEFEPEAMNDLMNSIKEKGMIQPITVRRIDNGRFQLISGERRLRAATMCGLEIVPAYIIKIETKEEMIELSLIENIQRETLNPIEIGLGFQRLMEECKLTQEEIARKTSKDRSTVANFIRLLKLPDVIQQSLIKNEITTGHARALINIDDTETQIKLWKKILEEKASVRVIEKLAKQKKQKKKNTLTLYKLEPNLEDLITKLRQHFGTKVNIKQRTDGSGEITIQFFNKGELERILEILNDKNNNYN